MNAIINPHVPDLAQIMTVQSELAKLPQVELETEHLFAEGLYTRICRIPAGVVYTGKIQAKSHIFAVLAGSTYLWTDTGMRTLNAGDVIVGQSGAKRIGVALTDCVAMTCHHTNKTDLDEIERDLIVAEDLRLFDARNKLVALEHKEAAL
jgi:hypothetical protein